MKTTKILLIELPYFLNLLYTLNKQPNPPPTQSGCKWREYCNLLRLMICFSTAHRMAPIIDRFPFLLSKALIIIFHKRATWTSYSELERETFAVCDILFIFGVFWGKGMKILLNNSNSFCSTLVYGSHWHPSSHNCASSGG